MLLYYKDYLQVERPAKVTTGKKCHYQKTDLPSCVNDNEAFQKVFIPTVYWHLGNQWDIWIYNEDELAKDLQKIFSAVYTSVVEHKVWADCPVFGMVSYIFLFIVNLLLHHTIDHTMSIWLGTQDWCCRTHCCQWISYGALQQWQQMPRICWVGHSGHVFPLVRQQTRGLLLPFSFHFIFISNHY